MRHKNQIIETEEVDLVEIIRKLWKDKFLIIFITLIFSVSSYLYISLKPKTFETTATLKSLPNTLFVKFENELKQNQQQQEEQQRQPETFQLLLTKKLQEKLNSFDNIGLFVKQNNKITSFKAFLIENKISAKDYFLNGTSRNKFGNVTNGKKIIENQYYLNFPQELKGNEFLDEYILFTFLKSEKVIRSQIISKLSNKKSNYEKYLARCLRSCLNQSLNRDLYEVILVDDNSTDNSLDVAKLFQKEKNFHLIKNKTNLGVAGSANKGILKSTADLVRR